MPRTAVLVTTIVLCLATAAVMVAAAPVLRTPEIPQPGAASEEVVRRFYDAANATIATGDLTALRGVVAPRFVDVDPLPGVGPGRLGLEAYLLALHASAPTMRLEPQTVVAADPHAIAQIAVRGLEGWRHLGNALAEPPMFWGPVDFFRVEGSEIVERRGITQGLVLPRPILQGPLDVPTPARPVITIRRFVYAPGAVYRERATAGTRVVHLESGPVTVEVDATSRQTARLVHARFGDETPIEEEVQPGGAVVLASGESLVLPEGTDYESRNDGDHPARLLMMSIVPPRPQGPAMGSSSNVTPTGITLTARAGDLATLLLSGAAEIEISSVALASGARLDLSPTAGPVLIFVESGSLDLRCNPSAWIRRGVDGVSSTAAEAVIATGDSALIEAGTASAMRNAGDEPAVVLVVSLTPRSSNSGPTPDTA